MGCGKFQCHAGLTSSWTPVYTDVLGGWEVKLHVWIRGVLRSKAEGRHFILSNWLAGTDSLCHTLWTTLPLSQEWQNQTATIPSLYSLPVLRIPGPQWHNCGYLVFRVTSLLQHLLMLPFCSQRYSEPAAEWKHKNVSTYNRQTSLHKIFPCRWKSVEV